MKMRTIRISEEVWNEIAKRGKFAETEDDVLRRVFNLPENANELGFPAENRRMQSAPRRTIAAQRMSSYIANSQLHVAFQDGASSSWELPKPTDKARIKMVLDKALIFARTNDASLGQLNAIRKALTNAGYHLTK
jgi:hypothetical protein